MAISYKDALSRAMSLCSRSEKAPAEILEKLRVWGLENEEERNKLIKDLVRNDFINEVRYCRAYVRDKHQFNRWGRIKIRTMLRGKGIKETVIENALSEIDNDSYRETLLNELVKKRKSVKASNRFDLKNKLLRFAASKGYETELIYSLLDDVD